MRRVALPAPLLPAGAAARAFGGLTRGCGGQDMLDLAHGRSETSRLGCQVTLTAHMEGMVVCIPDGCNNLMDHIPFKDK